jgi:hypothetical protein
MQQHSRGVLSGRDALLWKCVSFLAKSLLVCVATRLPPVATWLPHSLLGWGVIGHICMRVTPRFTPRWLEVAEGLPQSSSVPPGSHIQRTVSCGVDRYHPQVLAALPDSRLSGSVSTTAWPALLPSGLPYAGLAYLKASTQGTDLASRHLEP